MKRKWMAMFLAMMLGAAALTGCGNGSGEDPPGQGKSESEQSDQENENIVVVADTQAPTSLDLAQSWDSWYTSRWGITETLYMLDENL